MLEGLLVKINSDTFTVKVDNKYYFYTKGDANEIEDGYPITEDMIVGVVNVKVPYIGLPTVLLNEL